MKLLNGNTDFHIMIKELLLFRKGTKLLKEIILESLKSIGKF